MAWAYLCGPPRRLARAAPQILHFFTSIFMRLSFLYLLLVTLVGTAVAQRNYNLDLLSTTGLPQGESGNDCWGYSDQFGREFAVIGTTAATYVYSLEDARAPTLRARIPGATSVWRDIKSFGTRLYVVADRGTDGLLVIDMAKAPDTITHTFYKPAITVGGQETTLARAHNLYISKEGLLVLAGSNVYAGAPLFFDLAANPAAPPFVGASRREYAHDVYAERGRLYSSDINVGTLTVHDYTNLASITALGSQTTTSNFTHNAWPTGDDRAVFTTDERSQATVDAYDVSDPSAIRLIDRFRPEATFTSGSIPHNTHVNADFLVTSWYRDGVVLTDASRPHNLIEVGQYDTYPQGGGNGFNGCWGAYPFLPSGLVIASDIESGLFVFQPKYEQACYFEGTVQDSATGALLSGVTVNFDNRAPQEDITGLDGTFATGIYLEGAYRVTFSKPGYAPKTTVAQMRRGQLDFRNIKLLKIVPVNFNIIVLDAVGRPLPQAKQSIELKRVEGDFNRYDIAIGLWGYKPFIVRDTALRQNSTVNLRINLKPGYEDDFALDLGWASTGTAIRGQWARGLPSETTLDGQIVQIGADVDGDFGDLAYATGLAGGAAGDDDVDGGTARLTSPVFPLPLTADARVSFAYHFFNGGGTSTPNDTLIVELIGGGRTIRLFETRTNTTGWQRVTTAPLRGLLGLTGTPNGPPVEQVVDYRLVVRTGDLTQSGHFVEAMFDDFRLLEVVAPTLTASATTGCAPFTVTYSVPAGTTAPRFTVEGGSATVVNGNTVTTTYTTPGSYAVQVSTTDANGEVSKFDYPGFVTVGKPAQAEFSARALDALDVAFTNTSLDATSFAWDFGDGTGSTEAAPTHRYPSSGTYTVRLIATAACGSDTSSQMIRAQVVGVEELQLVAGLRLLNNPVNARLALEYSGLEPLDVQLFDGLGRVVLSQKLSGPGRYELLTASLPDGAYFLRAAQYPRAAATVIIRH